MHMDFQRLKELFISKGLRHKFVYSGFKETSASWMNLNLIAREMKTSLNHQHHQQSYWSRRFLGRTKDYSRTFGIDRWSQRICSICFLRENNISPASSFLRRSSATCIWRHNCRGCQRSPPLILQTRRQLGGRCPLWCWHRPGWWRWWTGHTWTPSHLRGLRHRGNLCGEPGTNQTGHHLLPHLH